MMQGNSTYDKNLLSQRSLSNSSIHDAPKEVQVTVENGGSKSGYVNMDAADNASSSKKRWTRSQKLAVMGIGLALGAVVVGAAITTSKGSASSGTAVNSGADSAQSIGELPTDLPVWTKSPISPSVMPSAMPTEMPMTDMPPMTDAPVMPTTAPVTEMPTQGPTNPPMGGYQGDDMDMPDMDDNDQDGMQGDYQGQDQDQDGMDYQMDDGEDGMDYQMDDGEDGMNYQGGMGSGDGDQDEYQWMEGGQEYQWMEGGQEYQWMNGGDGSDYQMTMCMDDMDCQDMGYQGQQGAQGAQMGDYQGQERFIEFEW